MLAPKHMTHKTEVGVIYSVLFFKIQNTRISSGCIYACCIFKPQGGVLVSLIEINHTLSDVKLFCHLLKISISVTCRSAFALGYSCEKNLKIILTRMKISDDFDW